MAQFYTLLTQTGQAKMANAIALGTMIEITHLAVGDGGGSLPVPDSSRTTLVNEVRRAPINRVEVDAENPNWLIVEQVLPPDVGGWTIREVGVIDADGDLIGYGNYPETYKPTLDEGSGRTQTIRMVLEVSATSAVTLKVDPSVVLATREYVDKGVAEHEKSRNHPAATTTELGFVEKATVTEAKIGAVDKFPDSAGVHAAFNQFGLGAGVSTTSRLNNLTASGLYYSTVAAGASDRPADADESGYVLVIRHGSNADYLVQYFTPYTTDRMFMRRREGVSGWTAWVEMYHSGNLSAATTAQAQAGAAADVFITPDNLSDTVIGMGQAWQDVTASRAMNTNYTNSTGRAIAVSAICTLSEGGTSDIRIVVDSIVISRVHASAGDYVSVDAIVPNGSTYILHCSEPTWTWLELR